MSTTYTEYSTEELLHALEIAGRHPDLDLLKACLDRPEELTPGLLEMMEEPDEEAHWLDEDPRWYRQVHAGKLLLAFREPEAMPLFEEILRNSERDTLLEWFDSDLHVFGPPFVPILIDIMRDESAGDYGRSLSIGLLGQIAREHPETRERVLEALRAELPPVSPEGEPDLDRSVTHDDVEHWSWVALALSELQDEQSRPQIEALYDAEWVDEFLIGDRDDYHATLSGERAPRDYEFDLLDEYARREEREGRRSSGPEFIARLLQAVEDAGPYPRPELIEDCVAYQEEITPGLLEMLREDVANREPDWDEDNPRWYRMIHAGLLLIHFREERAIPLIVDDFRQSSAERFNDWFEGKLRLFGTTALPDLIDLLTDEDAGVWGRVEAASELGYFAWAHPEERESIRAILRDVLPAIDEEGKPDVPEEVDEDQPLLWANVAYELGRLQDEESRPQIEALFEHDLIDPMMFGDQEAYHRLLQGKGEAWARFEPASFDVVAYYKDRYQEGQREAQWRVQRERRQERVERASEGGHYEGGTFVRDEPKVGRNDPCPCGSGRKYKHCCG